MSSASLRCEAHQELVMRLSATQAKVIRETAKQTFGTDAEVWLFGSRTDDGKRGGDIDLFLETSLSSADAVWNAQRKFLAKLYMALGEQKIDVVVKRRTGQAELPIHNVAKAQGIRL